MTNTSPPRLVDSYRWHVTNPDKTCANCAALDNQTLYAAVGALPTLRPPAHRNCRCGLIYTGKVLHRGPLL